MVESAKLIVEAPLNDANNSMAGIAVFSVRVKAFIKIPMKNN
ncbi:hypothetical protein BN4901_0273 [Citrobacter europaeus]|uniref:Uncharacterized protein n=1 Tax=Citrobacter europaeus TaxID=1914243 RepID=A0ABY0JKW3_9ENTR|nr:hypothetical protein BN4901_0273 [Citrobacter europaeus]